MSTKYYRVQAPGRDPQDLITDPVTYSWNTDETAQDGVSCCDSIEELATYLATAGQAIELWTDWVMVVMEGEYVGQGHDGESLIKPHTIISADTVTDEFFAMYEAAYDAAQEA